ncbi:MAG TPA: CopD family protein [bacterium]|nr:CopD family protein [bacterium]
MAEPLQVAAKAGVFIGIVLLLGAGVFGRWIAGPPLTPALRRRIRIGMLLGVILLIAGSALEVVDAIARATGAFDLSLVGDYLSDTRHGNAVVARTALAVLVVAVGGPPGPRRPRALDAALFTLMGAGLLLTITLVSHAGGHGHTLPILADFAHVAGVAAWGGSIVYLAWLSAWRDAGSGNVAMTARRASMLGAGSLTLILATGVYAAFVRLPDFGALVRTPYGQALLWKATAVAVVAALAAVNRWVAIPWMTRGVTTAALRRVVRIESCLILFILILTGVLVSQPLPEPPATIAGTLTFRSTTGPWVVHGSVAGRGADGFAVEARVQDARGAPAPASVALDLELTMTGMVMQPLTGRLPRVGPGLYRGTYQMPMSGQWQLTVRPPGAVVRVALPSQQAPAAPARVRWIIAGPALLALFAGISLAVTGLRRASAGTGRAASALLTGTALAAAAAVVVVVWGLG